MCLQFFMPLSFISCLEVDFLSFSRDGRHPLRSRSIHQNAANCMTICLRYIAQPGGEGYASAHVFTCDPSPVVQLPCGVSS